MRIGLLTVPFNNNFGGFLQAYALKTVLTELGHEVIIINRRRNRNLSYKGKIKNILIKVGIFRSPEKTLSVNTNKFVQKYLTPGTPYYYTTKGLSKCLKYNFDYCIVGSDQVWRYKYAQDSIDDYFFSFLKNTNIPRMSYAASFGVDTLDEYPVEKKTKCSELLKDFSGISVREDSGIRLLEEFGISNEKSKVVLDPTLLLTKEEYFKKLIKNSGVSELSERYVFNYVLDDSVEKRYISDIISQTIGCKNIRLKAQTGDLKKIDSIAPVEEWLSKIYHAEYVVTDSFHGTAFSIIFNKPFIVIGNSNRGLTRFQSLLKIFGLENRMIVSVNDFNVRLLNTKIDWYDINDILKRERIISELFLKTTLSNNNR